LGDADVVETASEVVASVHHRVVVERRGANGLAVVHRRVSGGASHAGAVGRVLRAVGIARGTAGAVALLAGVGAVGGLHRAALESNGEVVRAAIPSVTGHVHHAASRDVHPNAHAGGDVGEASVGNGAEGVGLAEARGHAHAADTATEEIGVRAVSGGVSASRSHVVATASEVSNSHAGSSDITALGIPELSGQEVGELERKPKLEWPIAAVRSQFRALDTKSRGYLLLEDVERQFDQRMDSIGNLAMKVDA